MKHPMNLWNTEAPYLSRNATVLRGHLINKSFAQPEHRQDDPFEVGDNTPDYMKNPVKVAATLTAAPAPAQMDESVGVDVLPSATEDFYEQYMLSPSYASGVGAFLAPRGTVPQPSSLYDAYVKEMAAATGVPRHVLEGHPRAAKLHKFSVDPFKAHEHTQRAAKYDYSVDPFKTYERVRFMNSEELRERSQQRLQRRETQYMHYAHAAVGDEGHLVTVGTVVRFSDGLVTEVIGTPAEGVRIYDGSVHNIGLVAHPLNRPVVLRETRLRLAIPHRAYSGQNMHAGVFLQPGFVGALNGWPLRAVNYTDKGLYVMRENSIAMGVAPDNAILIPYDWLEVL